jgi:hypothetical protein
MAQGRIVLEWKFFGCWFEEKIERVDHRHFGDQVDFHGEYFSGLVEYQPCLEIPLRVLLPVDEMVLGLDTQRVGGDPGAALRSGAEADDLGGQDY